MKSSESKIKALTRGGQILLHNVRMFFQIGHKIFLASFFIFGLSAVILFFGLTSAYQRYVFLNYGYAKAFVWIDPDETFEFKERDGSVDVVNLQTFVHSNAIQKMVNQVLDQLILSFGIGLLFSILSTIAISIWLQNKGKKHTEDIKLKGDCLVSPEELTQKVIKDQINSDLMLSNLPLIKGKETAHFLFHGTIGTGKSNAIKELLEQIRKRGERVIIYDKSCNYLEEFYRPTDVLLNPLDERGNSWDLWSECRDSADFDSLAAALMPMPASNQDPFWVTAARLIFSVTAFQMRNDTDRSILKLLRYLLNINLDLIQEYLKGTEAEALVSDKIEKAAVSIKAILSTYLKSLKYVKEEKPCFSIRQWIQNEKSNDWLFITSLGDRHETLKPLISTWLDIAVNALMSLPPDFNRRIWLILDELPSLQPLPYLTQTLAESRKFGGCVVVGIQNYSQLRKVYQHDSACEISSLLNTRLMFRQPDPDMAMWSANNFGESVIDQVNEGISYGANTMRDGISISRNETKKKVISYSEIMALPDLEAYVRLCGQSDLTKLQFRYQAREKINEPFKPREINENLMREFALLEREDALNSNDNDIPIDNISKAKKSKSPKRKGKTANPSTLREEAIDI